MTGFIVTGFRCSQFRGSVGIRNPCFFGGFPRVDTKGVMQQRATLRRILRRFFKGRCFLEELLEGACKSYQ